MQQRRWLIASLGLGLIVVGAALVAGVASREPRPEAVERALVVRVVEDDGPELVIYLPSEIDTAGIAPVSIRGIQLVCVDRSGGALLRARHPWPVGSSGFSLAHFHYPVVDERTLRRIARCGIKGARRPIEVDMNPRGVVRRHPRDQLLDPAAEGLGP